MGILKVPFPGLDELFVQHIFCLLDLGKIVELRNGIGKIDVIVSEQLADV